MAGAASNTYRLEDQVAAMSRLHELSVRLTTAANVQSVFDEVLSAVTELQHADCGDFQLFDAPSGGLFIVAHQGLGQDYLDYFRGGQRAGTWLSGRAVHDRRRIIVEDLETDPHYEAHRAMIAQAGVRAGQAMPLFDRNGGMPLGVVSTLFRNPHSPPERDLCLVDLYAEQAADVIAFRLSEQRVRASKKHFHLALQAARMGTWEWNADSGMLTADERHRSLFGLPPQSAPQPDQVYQSQMAPEEAAAGVQAARAALRDGTDFQAEQRIIQPDGKVAWLISRGRGKPDDPNCMVGVSFDITERKRMEEALRQSKERLHAAVDLLGLGLYAWDPQTNALEWDERVRAMWGLASDAPVDHEIWHASVHPDDLVRVDAAVARCIDPAGDGVYEIEYRVNAADGVQRWMSTRGRTTFRNGRAVQLVGVVLDVTARKRAEEHLRESEARLFAILRQLPVGVGLVDTEGRFVLRGGLLGNMWDDAMPSSDAGQDHRWRSYDADGSRLNPDDYPGARALRGETLVQGTDFIYRADDGHESWVRVSAAPFRNVAGEIEGAVAILQDIDAEKRTEQAMRESEERFRQFAEHSTDVLWILDVETRRFDYLSPAYESVSGRPRENAAGYWTLAIHPEDRAHASAELERAALGQLVVQEYRIIRPNGTLCSIRETMFPIRNQRGQVSRIGGIVQDITIHDTSQVYVIAGPERLSQFLQRAGYSVKAFASGAEFLEMAPVLAPGCVVFDTRESPAGGIDILRRFKANRSDLPVVALGMSEGDVKHAVQAMKAGAVDWLELPYEGDELLIAVASALADVRRGTEHKRDADFARARIAGMSGRERQVLEHLLAGGTNKEIARQLGISPRTVELHRASVMERLGVKTLPEAVLMAAAAGVRPALSRRRSPEPPE